MNDSCHWFKSSIVHRFSREFIEVSGTKRCPSRAQVFGALALSLTACASTPQTPEAQYREAVRYECALHARAVCRESRALDQFSCVDRERWSCFDRTTSSLSGSQATVSGHSVSFREGSTR